MKATFTKTWSCWPHLATKLRGKLQGLQKHKNSNGQVLSKELHEQWMDQVYELFEICHLCRTVEQGRAFIDYVMIPKLQANGEEVFALWALQEYLCAEQYDWYVHAR